MTELDLFGLKREARISGSGIRDIFTPHRPIQSVELFFGRQPQVKRIVESVLTPGQHGLLYGDRGVGKSSLANVTKDLLLRELVQGQSVVVRCDSTSTFAAVAEGVLRKLGKYAPEQVVSRETVEQHEGGLDVAIVKGATSRATRQTETENRAAASLNPAAVADAIGDTPGLLILDEFDAMPRVSDRRAVAELIKQLSDAGATLKVLVVGIAASSAELTAGHPSVQRCLREVRLGRMSDEEIAGIINGNATKAGLDFDPHVVGEIVELSAGYPHFAQLLGLKSAEGAIGEERIVVGPGDLERALSAAVADAEESLRRTYADAVRSYQTTTYGVIVEAAAELSETEFTAKELRGAVSTKLGRTVSQYELNNHFHRLVGADESKILKREAKGVYRFSDPRMKSYARIVARANSAADDSQWMR